MSAFAAKKSTAARDELRRLGLLAWELTELRPEGQASPAEPAAAANAPGTPLSSAHGGLWEGLRSRWGRARRVTAVAEFTRQATDLLEAGVPLAEALEVLVRQGGPMETVLRDLANYPNPRKTDLLNSEFLEFWLETPGDQRSPSNVRG